MEMDQFLNPKIYSPQAGAKYGIKNASGNVIQGIAFPTATTTQPIGGAALGVPWPAARRSGAGGILGDQTGLSGQYVQVSDGANWSSVSFGTPVITALSQIGGLQHDLDVSKITGLIDGAACASLPDQSGNGYTFTASGSAEPMYHSASQLTPSAKPTLSFDGISQTMNNATAPQTTAFTDFFIVARVTGGSGYLLVAPGSEGAQIGWPSAGVIQLNGAGGLVAQAAYILPLSSSSTPQFYMLVVRSDGVIRVDSTPFGSTAALVPQTFSGTGLYMGASSTPANFFAGNIARAVRYNVALTTQQICSVEMFLRASALTN
jgi:hypothetical protein